MFQFQSGAVKILEQSKLPEIAQKFQFQSGAVKILSFKNIEVCTSLFQFQSGAVKIWWKLQMPQVRLQVSIPKWCG